MYFQGKSTKWKNRENILKLYDKYTQLTALR